MARVCSQQCAPQQWREIVRGVGFILSRSFKFSVKKTEENLYDMIFEFIFSITHGHMRSKHTIEVGSEYWYHGQK